VDRELRRVTSSYVAPMALPGPETTPKSESPGARADVGPVLPLSFGDGEHNVLVGAGDQKSMTSDPVAAKVLSHGDALDAHAGRADDFSWPRPDAGAGIAPDFAPQPIALSPASMPKKGDEPKKSSDGGKDNKNKPAKESGVSKTRRSTNADSDGAPMPPAPVGSR
jgi:hypothetical protein